MNASQRNGEKYLTRPNERAKSSVYAEKGRAKILDVFCGDEKFWIFNIFGILNEQNKGTREKSYAQIR